MQRLFFGFPAGLPGAGLLLLRLAISITGLYEAHVVLAALSVPLQLLVAVRIVLYSALFALLIGLTTPIASLGLGIGAATALLLKFTSWPGVTADEVSLLNLVLLTIVNAAVGPGAFSVDARLFGRREIVFPD